MRTIVKITTVIALVLGGFDARASDTLPTLEEFVFQGAHIADLQQTLDIKHHRNYSESENVMDGGWIIGCHPRDSRIYAYFGGEAVLHLAITGVLVHYAPRWTIQVWELVTIGVEGETIAHNAKIGLKIRF